MKILRCALIAGFGLPAAAGLSAQARANATTDAWPVSEKLMDVVIASAPRPKADTGGDAESGAQPASVTSLAEVHLSMDSDLELRAQAAAAVLEALSADLQLFEGLPSESGEREPVL